MDFFMIRYVYLLCYIISVFCPPAYYSLFNLIVHDGVPGTSMAREREGVRETPGGGTRRQMALPVWSVEDERNSIFKASTT